MTRVLACRGRVDITPVSHQAARRAIHRSSVDYRRGSVIKHPPYGLYLDTRDSQFDWVVICTRVLMLLTLVMAVVVVAVVFAPWLTLT